MPNHNPVQENECTNEKRLDILIINPSMDWIFDRDRKIASRIEENIPNQETPHIGVAYLLAVSKREGLKIKYVDMVMDSFSLEQIIDCVAQTKPALIGFTAFTVQIRAAGSIAAEIKRLFPDIMNKVRLCEERTTI